MAELTYDPTPADQPEFNESELEALKVGEAQAEAENAMLAGKFKSPEDLEKAYLELQSKLGQSNGEEEQGEQETLQVEDETTSEYNGDGSVNWNRVDQEYGDFVSGKLKESGIDPWKISKDFWETGEVSAEDYTALEGAGFSRGVVDRFLKGAVEGNTPDLAPDQVSNIYQAVGGVENYNTLVSWASDNLPAEQIEAYNNVIANGDPNTIQLAVAGLRSAYTDVNGFEGKMLTGKPAVETKDVFRSQAEVLAAMQDPRYDRDPAYRSDVFEKLGRSPINY